jgi:hypothetical protein
LARLPEENSMVTKLHGQLKREIVIKGQAYVVTIDTDGVKLTLKGRRRGQELSWIDFSSGDAALATALNVSLARSNDSPRVVRKPSTSKHRSVKTSRKAR